MQSWASTMLGSRSRSTQTAVRKIQSIYNGKLTPITMQDLDETRKSRERKNNEERWKKQCAEQWKQSEIRASDQCPVVTPKDTDAAHETLTGGRELSAEFPDESGRNSHTLIYAISTNSEHAQQANRVPGTGSRRTRTKGRAV